MSTPPPGRRTVKVSICAIVETDGKLTSAPVLGELLLHSYDPTALPHLLREIAAELEK